MSKSLHQQRGTARVKLAQRHQVQMRCLSLDEMVREGDLVRTVVRYAESLDLTELYSQIKAVEGEVGRDAIDPRILFSLWLFATLEGINSGRRIAKLCTRDIPYMWICGEVSVNYHSICDFRTAHADFLDRVLIEAVSVLHHHGLIELRTIAQDGMRVRASAGSGSFKRQDTLVEAQKLAQEYMEQLESEDDDDDSDDSDQSPAQKSAHLRAARERKARLEEALEHASELQEKWDQRNSGRKKEHRTSTPRVSTTDPEARRMKMGDNGFRPAFNVQFSSDADHLVIVSTSVTNEGTDAAQMPLMIARVQQNYGVLAENYLVDGDFINKDSVTQTEKQNIKCYGPLFKERQQLAQGEDPYAPRASENAHFTAFRERMGEEAAQQLRKRRSAAAEFPNANCRNQGLQQFSVRGLAKVRAQTLWHVIAYNFRRFLNLVDSRSQSSYLEVLMSQ